MRRAKSRGVRWIRALRSLAWLAGWCGLLWIVASPWRELGGLVSERLRWWERVVLGMGLVIGYTIGDLAGQGVTESGGRRRRARWLLYPITAATAVALVLLRLADRREAIGIVVTAWLAYCAGSSTGLFGCGALRSDGPSSKRKGGRP